jgi:hypothetical protein
VGRPVMEEFVLASDASELLAKKILKNEFYYK